MINFIIDSNIISEFLLLILDVMEAQFECKPITDGERFENRPSSRYHFTTHCLYILYIKIVTYY